MNRVLHCIRSTGFAHPFASEGGPLGLAKIILAIQALLTPSASEGGPLGLAKIVLKVEGEGVCLWRILVVGSKIRVVCREN